MLNCFFPDSMQKKVPIFEGAFHLETGKIPADCRNLSGGFFWSFADVKQNNYQDAAEDKNIIVDAFIANIGIWSRKNVLRK